MAPSAKGLLQKPVPGDRADRGGCKRDLPTRNHVYKLLCTRLREDREAPRTWQSRAGNRMGMESGKKGAEKAEGGRGGTMVANSPHL